MNKKNQFVAIATALFLFGVGCKKSINKELTTELKPETMSVSFQQISLLGPPPIPPGNLLYVGAFCNQLQDSLDPRNPDAQAAAILALERDLGHPLPIVTHYYNHRTSLTNDVLAADAAHGRIPIITLTSGGPADSTLAGKNDSIFRLRARELKAFGKPVFLRYFTAMNKNGDGNRHSKDLNGIMVGVNEPARGALYIELWRYVRNLFLAEGATNVAWVWSVGDQKDEWKTGPYPYASVYYPGDDYVDWIGINAYQQREVDDYTPFIQRIKPFHDYWWERTNQTKPLLITETGAPKRTQTQTDWIINAHRFAQDSLPGLKAYNYWNSRGTVSDNEFFLEAKGLAKYIKMANDPTFSYLPSWLVYSH